MISDKKQKIYKLLKGIENGDPESVKVVNENKYIQHNPQTQEGGEGLAILFARLSKTNPKVEIVRLFQDNDYVFGHTIYNFSSERIGFEIFRYEGDQVVEHWDNIQLRKGDMVGGTIEVEANEPTELNRQLISEFITSQITQPQNNPLDNSIDLNNYVEHNPEMNLLKKLTSIQIHTLHRVLAEGNFVLSVSEGIYRDNPCSFYDLFRLKNKKIVEHWDTIEKIPPKTLWKNNNGKF